MDVFCQKHSESEDCISIIVCAVFKSIYTQDQQTEATFQEMLTKFKSFGFHKVKDLAKATVEKVSQMTFVGVSLDKLNRAMMYYDHHCGVLNSKFRTYGNGIWYRHPYEVTYQESFHPITSEGLHHIISRDPPERRVTRGPGFYITREE